MSTWYDYFWGNTQTVVADNMSNGVDTTPLLANSGENTNEVIPIGLTGQLDFQSQIGFSGQVTSGPVSSGLTSGPSTSGPTISGPVGGLLTSGPSTDLVEEFEKLDLTSGPSVTQTYTSGMTGFIGTSGFKGCYGTTGPHAPTSLPDAPTSLPDASKVIAKLNRMGLPGQLFCDQLIKCKAILAGSFPLQCVLNEDYAGSDIDIFIGNYSGDFETWIKDNLVEKGDKLNVSRHMYFIDRILSSQKYDLPSQVCLNLVRVNTPDLKTYVNNHFDLSFCRVTFDGQKLEVADPELTLRKVGYVSFFKETTEGTPMTEMEIEKEMKIFLKKNPGQPCKVINSDRFAYLAQRVQKYESRGFTILRPAQGLTCAIPKLEAIHLDTEYQLKKMRQPDRQVVINRLISMGLAGELFLTKMVEAKGLMAGSFPLQCVLDESFDGSDIDIFFSVPAKEILDDHKMDKRKQFNEFETWLYQTYGTKSRSHTYYIRNVLTSRKYQITPKVCINIVKVNRSDLKEFVKTTFDFSFCQTTFDGQNLEYPCPELTLNKVGFMANYDALKPKKGHHMTQKQFDLKHAKSSYHTRNSDSCKECHCPGVNSYVMLDMHNIYPDPVERLKTRRLKYESRGFKIITNPGGNEMPLQQAVAHAIFMKNRSSYVTAEPTAISENEIVELED